MKYDGKGYSYRRMQEGRQQSKADALLNLTRHELLKALVELETWQRERRIREPLPGVAKLREVLKRLGVSGGATASRS